MPQIRHISTLFKLLRVIRVLHFSLSRIRNITRLLLSCLKPAPRIRPRAVHHLSTLVRMWVRERLPVTLQCRITWKIGRCPYLTYDVCQKRFLCFEHLFLIKILYGIGPVSCAHFFPNLLIPHQFLKSLDQSRR